MANSDNQIAVDLKLQLDSLGADAAKAGKIISNGLASSVKGLGETTYEKEDRQGEEKKQREKRERAARNRKLDEADAARAAKQSAANQAAQAAAQLRQQQASKVSRGQIIRAGVSGLAGVGLGVPGLGSIAALAQINPVAAMVTASLRVLGTAIQTTARAAEEAKRYYAKTLQSGFGTNFTIKRSLLANAIGVGENEVWQYGAAVGALNEKFSHATRMLEEANPVLTQLSWETSVMKADFEALKAKIAVDLAPAMESFIKWVDELAKHLTHWATPPKDAEPQILEEQARRAFGKQEGITPALIEGDKPGFINRMLGLSSEPEADATKGFVDKTGADVTDKYKDKFEEFLKNFKPGAPPPVAYMKQLPASQWEHMGLTIGGSGGTVYARETMKNTAKIVSSIEKFLAVARGNEVKAVSAVFGLPSLP
jgi:lambda repressor-like predicted transcriptional regulator